MRLRPLTLLVSSGLLIVGLSLTDWVANIESERFYQYQRSAVLADASAVRARLEGEINSTLYLTRGLVAYISSHPQVTNTEFDSFARALVREGRHVLAIGLAPDNVLTYVYPERTNTAALGLHYLELPNYRDAVLRAINTGETVVAGPLERVQGGVGIVSRTPIYIPDSPSVLRYWGMASVSMDYHSLLRAAGLPSDEGRVEFALRGKDGLGSAGESFFGDDRLFREEAILMPVSLPGGEWQLAAVPRGGWANKHEIWEPQRFIGYSLALLISGLVLILLIDREREKHLVLHDPLTGLPNRLSFDLRLEHSTEQYRRHDRAFALLYVDLDDFKSLNNRIGRRDGDQVLAEVARRLRSAVRGVDIVARVGGDEFAIILDDVHTGGDATQVAQKLIELIAAPTWVNGTTIAISASVGVSFYPAAGDNPDDVVRRADRAMARAKSKGKNCWAVDLNQVA